MSTKRSGQPKFASRATKDAGKDRDASEDHKAENATEDAEDLITEPRDVVEHAGPQ